MAPDPQQLRNVLRDNFSPDELIELSFDLDIRYEDLVGGSHSTRVISLIGLMERTDRLGELERAIIERRPALRTNLAIEAHVIPVVIAAMTSDEAAGLRESSPGSGGESPGPVALTQPYAIGSREFSPMPGDLEGFRRLQRTITPADLEELLGRYGATRDAWKPHGQETIGELIQTMAERFDYEAIPLSHIVLSAQRGETERRLKAVFDLQQTSCLLIIDGLSLFHPRLRHLLRDCGLVTGAKPITTLFLTPTAPGCAGLIQQLQGEFGRTFSSVFFRFEQYDQLCEFGAFSHWNIRRWLDCALPQTARIIGGEDPNQALIESMRASLALQETGIDSFVFGEAGS